MEDLFKKKKTPLPPPSYVLSPLLTAKEIEVERNKINKDFLNASLHIC